jgi:hypothetical protein
MLHLTFYRSLIPLLRTTLLWSNSLSYRPSCSESLHAIKGFCATLIISRRNNHGPNLHGSAVAVLGRGRDPSPHPICTKNCASRSFSENSGSFYFLNSAQNHHAPRIYMASLSFIYNPLSLCPLVPQNWAAQLHSSAMRIA